MTARWRTLRDYEDGYPAGGYQCASELLARQLDQQLDIAPTHGP